MKMAPSEETFVTNTGNLIDEWWMAVDEPYLLFTFLKFTISF